MSTTVTIRLEAALREALEARAAAEGKPVSAFVRDVLETALERRPLAERVGALRGRLQPGRAADAWRDSIRARNWRD